MTDRLGRRAQSLPHLRIARRPVRRNHAGARGQPRLASTSFPGETLGVVGESGSGKSTTGRLTLGLEAADAGSSQFSRRGDPGARDAAWRAQRARMQMIYQDPLGALDRRLPVLAQVREPLDIHDLGAPKERQQVAMATC